MSRIGKKPVELPDGVTVDIQGTTVALRGPKGELSRAFSDALTVSSRDGKIHVERVKDDKRSRELHGLTRALIANMAKGVHEGYRKRLLIYGTGYSCGLKGRKLELNLGFTGLSVNKAPQFALQIPDGIDVVIETPAARGESNPAKLLIEGVDKQKVGQFAAEIRALRKPEPYNGKGVRYEDEQVRRKQGKAMVGAGG